MKRRGVSTYISVILMVFISIVGGVFIYSYYVDFSNPELPTKNAFISMDSGKAYDDGKLILYIRNLSNVKAVIDSIYIKETRVKVETSIQPYSSRKIEAKLSSQLLEKGEEITVNIKGPNTGLTSKLAVEKRIITYKAGETSIWRLDENTGDQIHDSISDNDGTKHNAQWTNGIDGSGLEFDGYGDYIEIPDDPLFQNTDQFTVSLWLNATDISSVKYIINKWRWTGGDYRSWYLAFEHLNLVWAASNNGQDNGRVKIEQSYLQYENKWAHIAASYNGSNLNLYINGTLKTTAELNSVYSTSQPLLIGLGNDAVHNLDFCYKGTMDEIHYHNRALNESEITTLYTTYTTE